MASSKKRRKIIVFSLILVGLIGLGALAVFRKREPVIQVQTEKVSRRNLTELVVANGKVQPVVQVKISPEVSGEIIELPVKEGQQVKKGDLILKIKPDFYIANRNQAEASYRSSLAGQNTAEANLQKAEAEFKRTEELYQRQLVSDSVFLDLKTLRDVAKAQALSSKHQVEMSSASLARADEELAKTTIVSPLNGTVSKLNSQLGERVVGTATMAGTDVMIIADLNEMEARVDVGEVDVVLIQRGQKTRLEVDAFKDRKFSGIVTEIANSSKGSAFQQQSTSQEATKFEVRILITEKESFRPGMSVTAEVETRSRTNALTVPIASVTARAPKNKDDDKSNPESVRAKEAAKDVEGTTKKGDKEKSAAQEVVFVLEGDHVKMVPVKIGISDDSHWEILDGLQDGNEVISAPYRAISRELEDKKKVKKGLVEKEEKKPGQQKDS